MHLKYIKLVILKILFILGLDYTILNFPSRPSPPAQQYRPPPQKIKTF